MTYITVVRHGITAWNAEGRAQGQSDVPLNEKGLEQAKLLAERMKGEQVDYIYTSDLSRARQTAQAVADQLGLPPERVISDVRLREVHGGLIEGTTEPERLQRWGEGWKELDLGIEEPEMAAARGSEMLEEIAKKHPGERILVVSHGAVLRHSLNRLLADYGQAKLRNTSVTRLTRLPDRWFCELHNCTAHLQQ